MQIAIKRFVTYVPPLGGFTVVDDQDQGQTEIKDAYDADFITFDRVQLEYLRTILNEILG